MKKIYFLTNIPTPYRNHFFNCMYEAGEKRGIDIKVYYMAKTERGRFWNYRDWIIKYNYDFLKNYGFYFKNIYFHFNPSVIAKLKREKPDYLVVAGAWNMPTVMYLMFFKFLLPSIKMGFWNEGNIRDEIYSKKTVIKKLKKFIYNRFDSLISSGMKSDELIKYYVKNPKIIKLYNVVNDSIFRNDNRVDFSVPRKLFIVAKLNERKNVFVYLKSIYPLLKDNLVKIKVAGEGEDKKQIESWIKENNLKDSIKLLGQISESEIIKELKNSDIFVLPSRREPFSLSLVEASFMAMPLLISEKIGAVPDIINKNGITFDPFSAEDIYEKTKKMITYDDSFLKIMSDNSRKNALENFSSKKVTEIFIDDLLKTI